MNIYWRDCAWVSSCRTCPSDLPICNLHSSTAAALNLRESCQRAFERAIVHTLLVRLTYQLQHIFSLQKCRSHDLFITLPKLSCNLSGDSASPGNDQRERPNEDFIRAASKGIKDGHFSEPLELELKCLLL